MPICVSISHFAPIPQNVHVWYMTNDTQCPEYPLLPSVGGEGKWPSFSPSQG